MRASKAVAAAVVVVVAAVTTLRTAGAMSVHKLRNDDDETPYPHMGRVNVTGLATLADQFVRTSSAADDDGGTTAVRVDVEFRMNRPGEGPNWQNEACGYELRANGTAGSATVSRSAHLPAYERAVCGDGHVYRAQFVRPGGTHRQTIRLPDNVTAVSSLELRANGENVLTVNTVCVRLRGGRDGGARAFCAGVELLRSCFNQHTSSDFYFNLGYDGISLSVSTCNVREIVFRDVGALADGFVALARNAQDADAQNAVCGNVELVLGNQYGEQDGCPVEKRYAASVAASGADDESADGSGGGGGGAPFEFRPERMATGRLLNDCQPRSDGGADDHQR